MITLLLKPHTYTITLNPRLKREFIYYQGHRYKEVSVAA